MMAVPTSPVRRSRSSRSHSNEVLQTESLSHQLDWSLALRKAQSVRPPISCDRSIKARINAELRMTNLKFNATCTSLGVFDWRCTFGPHGFLPWASNNIANTKRTEKDFMKFWVRFFAFRMTLCLIMVGILLFSLWTFHFRYRRLAWWPCFLTHWGLLVQMAYATLAAYTAWRSREWGDVVVESGTPEGHLFAGASSSSPPSKPTVVDGGYQILEQRSDTPAFQIVLPENASGPNAKNLSGDSSGGGAIVVSLDRSRSYGSLRNSSTTSAEGEFLGRTPALQSPSASQESVETKKCRQDERRIVCGGGSTTSRTSSCAPADIYIGEAAAASSTNIVHSHHLVTKFQPTLLPPEINTNPNNDEILIVNQNPPRKHRSRRCDRRHLVLPWYVGGMWVLNAIALPASFLICVMFWTLDFPWSKWCCRSSSSSRRAVGVVQQFSATTAESAAGAEESAGENLPQPAAMDIFSADASAAGTSTSSSLEALADDPFVRSGSLMSSSSSPEVSFQKKVGSTDSLQSLKSDGYDYDEVGPAEEEEPTSEAVPGNFLAVPGSSGSTDAVLLGTTSSLGTGGTTSSSCGQGAVEELGSSAEGKSGYNCEKGKRGKKRSSPKSAWDLALNVATHGITFVLILADNACTSVPYLLIHGIYFFVFAVSFLVWSYVHYVLNIGDGKGHRSMYKKLNWGEPYKMQALSLAVLLLVVPLLNFVLWGGIHLCFFSTNRNRSSRAGSRDFTEESFSLARERKLPDKALGSHGDVPVASGTSPPQEKAASLQSMPIHDEDFLIQDIGRSTSLAGIIGGRRSLGGFYHWRVLRAAVVGFAPFALARGNVLGGMS